MAKIFVVSNRQLRRWFLLGLMALVTLGAAWYWGFSEASTTSGLPDASGQGEARTIQLVTGEFKSTGADGKEIEAYRWDPGTIYVKKGERINLSIYGVNGTSHPFIIDGLNVKGEVKKGKETVVSFRADKPGIYRIICLTHPDIAHNGPMVGYIVVDD
ncbi:cupredoxin domain-containing protein [Paenibacillus sp. NPDC056579]|uniref:cupredoxin domain-containing protein n=1 Tax=unclassified Paenibacillus TaxID=185978 RepID=UPI001EF7BE13|nr:cupredoxin domain-containing protein [Paenibacillus sp. H1-7]